MTSLEDYASAVAKAQKEQKEQQAWDRFAAAYISGRISRPPSNSPIAGTLKPDSISVKAAEYADAMLEERRKRFGGPTESE